MTLSATARLFSRRINTLLRGNGAYWMHGYSALAEDVAAAIPDAVRRATRTLRVERAVARQEAARPVERLQAREAQPEEPSPVTTLVAEVSHAANRGFAAVRNFFA